MWVRHEFPWLGYGFIHAVDDSYTEEFVGELERREVAVNRLGGGSYDQTRRLLDRSSAIFGFPDC
jgi:hypothetical protein